MGEIKIIEIKEEILGDNQALAATLRERLVGQNTFVLNLMASPGAGKTSLVLRTVEKLGGRYRIGVLQADIASTVDAEKFDALGVPTAQIRTGGMCHVDATMVERALEAIGSRDLDLVVLENVGNLVCPAEFDTGAHKNAMLLSIPEGDDKPLKYPLMFSISDLLVLHKIDYLPLADFDTALAAKRARALNPDLRVIQVSSKTGEGLDLWTDWLCEQVDALRHRAKG